MKSFGADVYLASRGQCPEKTNETIFDALNLDNLSSIHQIQTPQEDSDDCTHREFNVLPIAVGR